MILRDGALMFKVVLHVAFESALPSQIVDNIRVLRNILSENYKCVCSKHLAPLLCNCSSVLIKLFIERSSLSRDMRMAASPSFTLVFESTNPRDLVDVVDSVLDALKGIGGKYTLVD